MKGHLGVFALGLGLAAAGAFAYERFQSGEIDTTDLQEQARRMAHRAVNGARMVRDKAMQASSVAQATLVDLNEASREDLRRLGVDDPEMLDRLVENRPYRNKMDLLARMIVPEDLYQSIKDRVDVQRPDEGIKVA